MWQALKRLLGWDAGANDVAAPPRESLPYGLRPKRPEREPAQSRRQPPVPKARAAQPRPETPTTNPPTPTLSLEQPGAEPGAPPDAGFDPYNTGAFNRSSSWEKISKQRDR